MRPGRTNAFDLELSKPHAVCDGVLSPRPINLGSSYDAQDSPKPPSAFWTDRSHSIPRRTASPASARTAVSARKTPLVGALAGAVGALIGTFAGYHIRHAVVTRLGVKDIFVALTEDVITIVLAYSIVRSVISQ